MFTFDLRFGINFIFCLLRICCCWLIVQPTAVSLVPENSKKKKKPIKILRGTPTQVAIWSSLLSLILPFLFFLFLSHELECIKHGWTGSSGNCSVSYHVFLLPFCASFIFFSLFSSFPAGLRLGSKTEARIAKNRSDWSLGNDDQLSVTCAVFAVALSCVYAWLTDTIGIGVFGLPNSFYQSGIWLGIGCFMIAAFFTSVCLLWVCLISVLALLPCLISFSSGFACLFVFWLRSMNWFLVRMLFKNIKKKSKNLLFLQLLRLLFPLLRQSVLSLWLLLSQLLLLLIIVFPPKWFQSPLCLSCLLVSGSNGSCRSSLSQPPMRSCGVMHQFSRPPLWVLCSNMASETCATSKEVGRNALLSICQPIHSILITYMRARTPAPWVLVWTSLRLHVGREAMLSVAHSFLLLRFLTLLSLRFCFPLDPSPACETWYISTVLVVGFFFIIMACLEVHHLAKFQFILTIYRFIGKQG